MRAEGARPASCLPAEVCSFGLSADHMAANSPVTSSRSETRVTIIAEFLVTVVHRVLRQIAFFVAREVSADAKFSIQRNPASCVKGSACTRRFRLQRMHRLHQKRLSRERLYTLAPMSQNQFTDWPFSSCFQCAEQILGNHGFFEREFDLPRIAT